MQGAMTVIGLMSGTSMDGIDVALIATEGERLAYRGQSLSFAYAPEEREALKQAAKAAWRVWGPEAAARHPDPADMALLERAERALTERHASAVTQFLDTFGLTREDIQLIGFHGQTVYHDASRRITRQLGDGPLLAKLTGIDVVHDFRSADVNAGGQGAPLVPAYHRALADATGLPRPLVIVNIGGVANVTWIGKDGSVLAFDVGPGNGLLDDWVERRTGEPFDRNGGLAQNGRVDRALLARLTGHPYFTRTPPKSLDRYDFPPLDEPALSTEDGAATLTAFTAWAVAKAADFMPEPPRLWLLAGGGAKNPTLVRAIADAISRRADSGHANSSQVVSSQVNSSQVVSSQVVSSQVVSAEEMGWSTDHLEAEAFGFLAVRSLRKLPLTFPGTTGVPKPLSGGRLAPAPKR
jgi:anhydro-N-acetylmuramic acid kinase